MKTIFLLFAATIFLVSACTDKKDSVDLINTKAAIPASFKFDSLGLQVITSSVNKKQVTMSVLYGNALGVQCAKSGIKEMPAGILLALLTWGQQPDKNWFGGNIPAGLRQIEFVKTTAANGAAPVLSYTRYEGNALSLAQDTAHNAERISYILAQKPSIMP